MQQFLIEGGYPLNGTLEVGGNKNAVLKLMAACLLTDQPVTLTNVPSILDVRVMADILRKLGAQVDHDEAARRMTIHAERLHTHVSMRRSQRGCAPASSWRARCWAGSARRSCLSRAAM